MKQPRARVAQNRKFGAKPAAFDSHPIYATSKMCMRDSSHRRTEADLHGFVYPFTGFDGGCDTLKGNDTLEGKDGF